MLSGWGSADRVVGTESQFLREPGTVWPARPQLPLRTVCRALPRSTLQQLLGSGSLGASHSFLSSQARVTSAINNSSFYGCCGEVVLCTKLVSNTSHSPVTASHCRVSLCCTADQLQCLCRTRAATAATPSPLLS